MTQRPRKRLSWLSVIILVAALCTVAFLIARQIVIRNMPAIRESIALPASPTQDIQPMSNGVVYYDGSTLRGLNSRAKQVWTYSAGSIADFYVDRYGVSTWSGSHVTFLTDRGSTIHSSDMQKTVLSARLGEKYAAVQIGEEHNSQIVAIERERGRQVDTIDVSGVTILNYGFYNNGNLLWVLSLNTEGTVPLCMITTYQPNRVQKGSISESDQIIYKVIFQSSQILAVGTKHIRSYDYMAKEKKDERVLVYGWYAVSIDDDSDNPLMAFAPTSQTSGIPQINDVRLIKGDQEQRIRLPISCFSVFVNNNTMYGFSNQYVFVAHMSDKKPTAYALPVYADSVFGITGDGSAIISSDGVVYLVPLPS